LYQHAAHCSAQPANDRFPYVCVLRVRAACACCVCVLRVPCVAAGGDSGTGEYPLMALDYFLWTNDSATFVDKYLKIPVQAATYLVSHFKNVSTDGRVIVWPAQVRWACVCTCVRRALCRVIVSLYFAP
jgi:hypothetical protein